MIDETALQDLITRAQSRGAEEVTLSYSRSTQFQSTRRDGKVEQASAATSRGLSLSLLAEGRYATCSTSDLRPEALYTLLDRCLEAAQVLEPDPDRRLAPPESLGRGAPSSTLDLLDPTEAEREPEQRAAALEALEAALVDAGHEQVLSRSTWLSEGRASGFTLTSTGFRDSEAGTWFAHGADLTLKDGDARPEAGFSATTRHLADLPSATFVAERAWQRAQQRLGARPLPSGRYPLVLDAPAVGRVLGLWAGPLSGGSLRERRSCLADQLGRAVGSTELTLLDDPLRPRGLASRAWDGDLLPARRRVLIDQGVLQDHLVGVYAARKLGRPPSTGGRSNWIVPVGDRPWQEQASVWPEAILITSFLGGNSNGATGDFSLGVRGLRLVHGQPAGAVGEMNLSGNLLTFFHRLVGRGDDPWTYGSTISPTLLFDAVDFSGT